MDKNFMTIDGNTAASHIAYAFSEVAAIYPITPSSPMGEMADIWAVSGRENVFGEKLNVMEMQSEAGAAGAVHGSLSAGALTTTYTASQGLLLMIPNMYKIAGEMLPTVFHVSARSLAAQALSIFGDHADVMAVRQTGFAMTAASSVQETMDLALVAHLATLEAQVPFLSFFDGFRTSHEIQKVEMIDYDLIRDLINMEYVERFRDRAMRPEKPIVKVAAQNPDVYFQGRESINKYYDAIPEIVQKYMDIVGDKIGRKYRLFDYVGDPNAEKLIIAMGSANDTIEETVDYLTAKGEKVGAIKVRLYRPFSAKDFIGAVPASVKKIAVLDRTKEIGSVGEPLFLDVKTVLADKDIEVIGGRYGLSSKEFTPSMVKAVYDHLDNKCTTNFTVGINDDVTNLSIPVNEEIDTEPAGVKRSIFWGYGSDGTVGANKNSIKIIGNNTDMYAQGYFSYDSKKSGGITISHLRFGKDKIKSPYLITKADFVALHKPEYIGRYNVLDSIKEGGTFLLNSEFSNDEVFDNLTKKMQKIIIDRKIKFYNINAYKIAKEEFGNPNRINTVMQAAFFKISEVMDQDVAIKLIKDYIEKTFAKKGQEIVQMNWNAVDKASAALVQIEVPSSITTFVSEKKLLPDDASEFMKNIVYKIMKLEGDTIPVSQMSFDGTLPTGTTKVEKRGVAVEVPHWISENCIQCNQCSFVCPHGAIRSKQISKDDLTNAPEGFVTLKSKTKNENDLEYKIQVYIEDCVGCGSCVEVCPSPTKSLMMSPLANERAANENKKALFFDALPNNVLEGTKEASVKGSQFKQPLFEFSGACAGCGETPYVKLATQLFGDRMIIANATGCSSIYGGTFPTIPYAVNDDGYGPAWGNSLFEDNAEYGFGMRLAVDVNRRQLKNNVTKLINAGISEELKSALEKSIEIFNNTDENAKKSAKAVRILLTKETLSGDDAKILAKVKELQDYFLEKSIWAFGGDGWAYDIGYGGLDHVLASNKNINVLVMDTEVYSNTGGQASKASPMGAVAKFAADGKKIGKKDLGLITMTYGTAYVASVSMGANKNQLIKALKEAEAYNGPSLVIAYAPCISHGFDLKHNQAAEKMVVDIGHWPLFRFNPELKAEGKNPLIWEAKDPTANFHDYLMGEKRFSMLKGINPEGAEQLFKDAEIDAKKRMDNYKKLVD